MNVKYRSFQVVPSIPEPLAGLRQIAMNYRWCWDKEAIELFQRLDMDLWRETHQNPVLMLGRVDQKRLEELTRDDSYLAHLELVMDRHKTYMENKSDWYQSNFSPDSGKKFSYFSAEFAVAECLPIYSGGLGVLSGDHLKAASDLGIPLTAVGLAYRLGYFQQYLNADGWQLENYVENDFPNQGMETVRDGSGEPLRVMVELPDGDCVVEVKKVLVGKVPLYLMDTNIDANPPAMRDITNQLYVGDREARIRQEMILGVGGLRALLAMDIVPDICHMNEGHSAFLALEQIRSLMDKEKLSFDEAKIAASGGNVFTTHTPVPAGNEIFDNNLVWKYCSRYAQRFGIDREHFLGLGRQNPSDTSESFCMTVLALRCCDFANGVSKLHGEVSRGMWTKIWPGLPDHETPITSITNGVHTRTWISSEMTDLFDRYIGRKWQTEPANQKVWERVSQIPDSELWRTHERRRERLVVFCRKRLRQQLINQGRPQSEIRMADEALDPEALTIGFARRFATYKRGNLIFRDPERLGKILANADRPVQLIFAGKAHPADNQGKEMIRQISHFARQSQFRHHVLFLQNYDMEVARYMYQGCDVWLNNPRRPLEASGTSGMKAAANGALNLSIPDGWWEEGYNGENGFNVGHGESYDDLEYQNEVESRIIYDMIEKEIVPLFYDRSRDSIPREWVNSMKNAMRTIIPVFSANRMVQDYTEMFYEPASERHATLKADKFQRAKALNQFLNSVRDGWKGIEILDVEADTTKPWSVGESMPVAVNVKIGDMKPENISVEVSYGKLDLSDELIDPQIGMLEPVGTPKNGVCRFEGRMDCSMTGHFGYAVRVRPSHSDMTLHVMPGFVTWK